MGSSNFVGLAFIFWKGIFSIIFTRSWSWISPNFLSFALHCVNWGIFTKFTWRFIHTWARLLFLSRRYYIFSFRLTHFINSSAFLNFISVRIVVSRSWIIIPFSFFWSPFNSCFLGRCTEFTTIGIISWTWCIFLFFINIILSCWGTHLIRLYLSFNQRIFFIISSWTRA